MLIFAKMAAIRIFSIKISLFVMGALWMPVSLVFAQTSQSACESVELRDQLQAATAYRQGHRPWCYAYVAADLVSQVLGSRVSADDIALETEYSNFSQDNARVDLDKVMYAGTGRHTDVAIEKINTDKGFCVESRLPSGYGLLGLRNLSALDILKIPDIHSYFISAYEPHPEFPNRYRKVAKPEESLSHEEIEQMLKRNNGLFAMSRKSRSMLTYRREDGVVETRMVFFRNPENLITRKDSLCGARVHLPTNTVAKLYRGERVNQLHVLNSKLNAGMLVGMTMPATAFRENESGHHIVTVVGRRWSEQKNSCQYLVRNTWGRGWAKSAPQGVWSEDATNSSDAWVDDSYLLQNLSHLVYMDVGS